MNYRAIALAVIGALTFGLMSQVRADDQLSPLERKTESAFTELGESSPVPEGVQDEHNFNLRDLAKYKDIAKKCVEFSESKEGKYCLVVDKATRTMDVYTDGRLTKSYQVDLGYSPIKDKKVEGDGKTPEGLFDIPSGNPKHRKFHKSLFVGYPNSEDAKRGLEDGIINRTQYEQIVNADKKGQKPLQTTDLGSYILIHGVGIYQQSTDWTLGCIALSDSDIDDLYKTLGLDGAGPRERSKVLEKTQLGIVRYGGKTDLN